MSFFNAFTARAALPRTRMPKYGRFDDNPLGPPAFSMAADPGGGGGYYVPPNPNPGGHGWWGGGPVQAGRGGYIDPHVVDPGGGPPPPPGPGPGPNGGPHPIASRPYNGDPQPEYTAANPMLDYLVHYWSNIAGTPGWQGAKGYWDSGFGAARPDLLEAYKALLARLGAPEGAWGNAPGGGV